MQPDNKRPKPEVVVFHSAYGLRPAIIEFADKLRAAGHLVHTPDLYDGQVFSDRNDAIRKIQELGLDKLLERALAAVESLPHDLVYAGFSNGGACAELLAASRRGARGAILIHAPLMVRDLGWAVWPSNVSVQVHFADKDPLRNQGDRYPESEGPSIRVQLRAVRLRRTRAPVRRSGFSGLQR